MSIDRSTEAKALVQARFYGKDFSSIRQEVLDNLAMQFNAETVSNFVASDLFVMMLEGLSFALANLHWYGDRQAGETSLDLEDGARIRSNAVAIARVLGYVPYGAVPPVVELSLTVSPAAPVQFTIQKGTKLSEKSGLPYELAESVTFGVGETGPKTILARQGETVEELFTSNGLVNQRVFLETVRDGYSIAEGTVDVRVGGVAWEPVKLLTPDVEGIYEPSLGTNPPFVRFGDGTFGLVPETDAEIRVTYFVTLGPDGAIASQTITNFVDPVYAVPTLMTTTISHTSPSSPGSFRESLESIKRNAALVFQAGDRAVTIKDLDGLINSYVDPTWGAVAKGRATTPRSAEADARLQSHIATLRNSSVVSESEISDLEDYWSKVLSSDCRANVVMAQILSEDSEGRYIAAPVGLAQGLESYLDERAESTVKVWVVDGAVNLFLVDIDVQIKVIQSRDTEVLRASIVAEVSTLVRDNLLGRDYGEPLRVSDLYSQIEAVDGVDYANLSVTQVLQNGEDVTSAVVDSYGNVIVDTFQVITMGSQPVVSILS